MSEHKYLSAAETAKLIRVQLKKHFPACKFWVTSDTYSGGASIDIHWIDGPASKEVEKITNGFNGAEFDGMVDLKSYNAAWLLPDGSAVFAEYAQDSQTTIHTTSPHPQAQRVHFGADYIFTHRHFTPAFAKPVIRAVCESFGKPEPHYYQSQGFFSRSTKSPCELLDWDCRDAAWGDLDYHINKEIREQLDAIATTPAKVEADPQRVQTEDVEISWDRQWTWIKFPKKPSPAVLDLLKDKLSARYSGRRGAWYVMEQLDPQTIRMQIAAV